MISLARSSELGEKTQRLAGFLLSGWGSRRPNRERFVGNDEMRDVLIAAGEEFRAQTLWHLQRWSADEPRRWRRRMYYLLNEVWPKQRTAKTGRTSSRLFEIAVESGAAFPRLVSLVTPLMGVIDPDAFVLVKADRSEFDVVARFPVQMLDLLYVALDQRASRWPYGAEELVNRLAKEPTVQLDGRLVELRRRLAAR